MWEGEVGRFLALWLTLLDRVFDADLVVVEVGPTSRCLLPEDRPMRLWIEGRKHGPMVPADGLRGV